MFLEVITFILFCARLSLLCVSALSHASVYSSQVKLQSLLYSARHYSFGKKKTKIFDMFALSCASLHLSSFLWKTSHITILQEGFKLSGGLHLGTENAGSFHFKNTICLTQMYIISVLLSLGVHIRRINLSCT